MDTFDLDAGLYECVVRNVFGHEIKTHSELIVDEIGFTSSESSLCFLRRPLPLIVYPEDLATFYAKVYPSNTDTKWSVNGRTIEANTNGFTVSTFFFYF